MTKYAYAFSPDGQTCHEAHTRFPGQVPLASFQANYPACVVGVFDQPQHTGAPKEALQAVIEDGQVVSVGLDPTWSPPPPATDPIEELRVLVRGNLLASEHDKRWLAQKEAAKREGIPWIKAHPACTQEQFAQALADILAQAFPGEPVVASPLGIIKSYAAGAHGRGHIPAATFEALRDLVAATPEKNLQALLTKL